MPRKRDDGLCVIEALISEDLKEIVIEESDLLGISRSQFLAIAIEKYCNVKETIRELGIESAAPKPKPRKKKAVKKPKIILKKKPVEAPVEVKDSEPSDPGPVKEEQIPETPAPELPMAVEAEPNTEPVVTIPSAIEEPLKIETPPKPEVEHPESINFEETPKPDLTDILNAGTDAVFI